MGSIKPKFIEYFYSIATRTAALSQAEKLKVGCVIVKDHRILSIGYNGTPTGWDNVCEEDIGESRQTKDCVIHAERNALDKIAKSTESSDGATLFVTHAPCIECAKSIYNTGIQQVYYINEYEASIGSGIEFLEKAGVKVYVKT
jgi:dCMP deaminase